MAATPTLPEVLAISDKGNLDLSNIPENGVRDFVNLLGDYIEVPDTSAIFDGEVYTVTTPWETTALVPAMCKVKWDQKYPYNQYTPIINGVHADVGCAGVAIAQAMSIYGYPTTLLEYTFDWDAMTFVLPTDDANKQIARLMEILGRENIGSFIYGPNGTSANPEDMADIFNRCGYHAIIPSDTRDNPDGTHSTMPRPYSLIDICGELKSSRPVVVYGTTGKGLLGNISAHFWLLHGYMQRQRVVEQRVNTATGTDVLSRRTEVENYVRCNWGWSGLYDGYYLNGVFNQNADSFIPEQPGGIAVGGGGSNYSYQLVAVIGIFPN